RRGEGGRKAQASGPNAANQAQGPATGQAQNPPPQGMPAQGQAQGQGQAQPGMAPGNTTGATGATTGAGNANAQQNANTNANVNAQGGQAGVLTLNEQQNTRVAAEIRQANVQPLTNVNFSIAVGTAIPADIQLHPLPPVLVEFFPQY